MTENTQGQADLIDGSYCEWNSGKASEPQRPFTEMERCSSKCSSARTSSQTGYGEDSTDDR